MIFNSLNMYCVEKIITVYCSEFQKNAKTCLIKTSLRK